MAKYEIVGGTPLKGSVVISGAKNAAVAILPAALLVSGPCRIENVPNISDVTLILQILRELGAETAYNLDGGSSSTMVFKDKKITAPTNPKVRYLCDIIYFASAWQPEK